MELVLQGKYLWLMDYKRMIPFLEYSGSFVFPLELFKSDDNLRDEIFKFLAEHHIPDENNHNWALEIINEDGWKVSVREVVSFG